MLSEEHLRFPPSPRRGKVRQHTAGFVVARSVSQQELEVAEAVLEAQQVRYRPAMQREADLLRSKLPPESVKTLHHLIDLCMEMSRSAAVEGFRQAVCRAALMAGDLVEGPEHPDLPTVEEMEAALDELQLQGQILPDEAQFGLTERQQESAQAVRVVVERRFEAAEAALVRRIMQRSETLVAGGAEHKAELQSALDEAMHVSRIKTGEMLMAAFALGVREGRELAVQQFNQRLRMLAE